MKIASKIENIIVIVLFAIILAFPYYANILNWNGELVGAEEKVEFSFENIDEYLSQNFPGRAEIMRLKNQFLYSAFDISPNGTIVKVGDNLFATETLNYYYHGLYSLKPYEIKKVVNKLVYFNEYCKKNDKKMLVILTPTKLRYYDGAMPFTDYIIKKYSGDSAKNDTIKPYDMLKDELNKTDIYCFDAIEEIDKNKYKYMNDIAPLFYKSGHHWSNLMGRKVSLALQDYMRDKMELKVPYMNIVATPSDVAIDPDADLFYVLNIEDKPNEKFYEVSHEVYDFQTDNLNFIMHGGSFTVQLMLPAVVLGGTGDIVQMINKKVFYNNYSNIEDFESYDELNTRMNLLEHAKNADVFIFEIHEVNVYNATFGFLDYLLEHEEDI